MFETADGKTQPALIPAVFEGEYYTDEEEDSAGAAFGAERGEGDLLFRNSGYGRGGMLPGLPQANPSSIYARPHQLKTGQVVDNSDEEEDSERPRNTELSEGEATKYLRKIKERRRSEGVRSQGKGVDTIEDGVRGLNVNN